MRRSLRSRLQRLLNGSGDLIIAELTRRTRSWLVVEAIHVSLCKAIAPDGVCANAQLLGNLLVLQTISRRKYDAGSLRNRLRRPVLARKRRQRLQLAIIQDNRYRPTFRHPRLQKSRRRECI